MESELRTERIVEYVPWVDKHEDVGTEGTEFINEVLTPGAQISEGVLTSKLPADRASDAAKKEYLGMLLLCATTDNDPTEKQMRGILAIMSKTASDFQSDVQTLKQTLSKLGALPSTITSYGEHRSDPALSRLFEDRRPDSEPELRNLFGKAPRLF